MKVEICKEPFTHIIIDDWLPWVHNLKVINELVPLMPFMRDSKVNSDQGLVKSVSSKSSKNLWLFQHYAQFTTQYKITELFEKNAWKPEMAEVFKQTGDSLFQSMLYTDSSQMLLSKYENGDHYEWHRDYSPTATMNYMVAKEPLKFKGGDFIFGGWDEKSELKRIEFKNNRLVIFPSRVWHKVEPVTDFKGHSQEARFTIQYWSKLKNIRET